MCAVSISGVSYRYSGQSVLLDVNAHFEYGHIYSLLGPSGAGKTTLLRLVLGLLTPHSGRIRVLGHEPGTQNRLVGYMPQDMALCASFTVRHTLQYFGTVYRMSRRQVAQRLTDLAEWLHLPDEQSPVGTLSGGQQKVLSLCLALLHQPRLLILDEPTVGSDPLASDRIWKYLHQCCHQSVSVVIVTHYTEEACLGHRVGFLRGGRILEEGCPVQLKQKYNKHLLEDVFLHICLSPNKPKVPEPEEDLRDANNTIELTDPKVNEATPEVFASPALCEQLINSVWILFALMRRNIHQLNSLYVYGALFVTFFPVWFVTSIHSIDPVIIPTAVYNGEVEPRYSQVFLNSSPKLDVYQAKLFECRSFDEMVRAVEEGKAMAGIWFEANFSDSLDTRILEPDYLDEQDERASTIKVYVDNDNYYPSFFINGALQDSALKLMNNIYVEHNLSHLESLIDLKEVIYADGSKLVDVIVPGYVIIFFYFPLFIVATQLLIKERSEGLFERSLVAGVGPTMVLLSHILTTFLIGIVEICIILLMLRFPSYDIYNVASYWALFLFLLPQATSAISAGLFLSSILKQPIDAVLLSILISFSQLMCSGAIFPHAFFKTISLRPVLKWASLVGVPAESFRNLMERGWDLTHPQVAIGILFNLTTLLLFPLTVFAFKRNTKFS